MSDFFEPPPPRETSDITEHEAPPWFGAPNDVLPCAVPIAEIVARGPSVAVGLVGALAYLEGLELQVFAFLTDPTQRFVNAFHLYDDSEDGAAEEGRISDRLLRIGIEYPDGRKSMNTTERWFDDDEAADGRDPTLIDRGGSTAERKISQTFWCWPLPSEGDLQFVCEWPYYEVPLTRHRIDGELIREAAGRAQRIES